MFIGEYLHTLDNKGRVTIPSKFRDGLEGDFVMTKGLDNCLFLYPMEEWQEIELKLKKLPLTNRESRAFLRFFFAGASEGRIDKQGRILIPPNLREFIEADKELVIIGISTRVEIWSKEKWDEYNSNEDLSYEEIAEKLWELDI